jgi:hypothetical protein
VTVYEADGLGAGSVDVLAIVLEAFRHGGCIQSVDAALSVCREASWECHADSRRGSMATTTPPGVRNQAWQAMPPL